jgi:hypothetical protein
MFLDGWMDGWMGGWVGVKAVLRIAYSNQKIGHVSLKVTDLVQSRHKPFGEWEI